MLRYPLFCDLQGKDLSGRGGREVAAHKCRTLLQGGRMSPSLPAGSTEIHRLAGKSASYADRSGL